MRVGVQVRDQRLFVLNPSPDLRQVRWRLPVRVRNLLAAGFIVTGLLPHYNYASTLGQGRTAQAGQGRAGQGQGRTGQGRAM